jgi:DNA-binding MarR family transcriptional regulator
MGMTETSERAAAFDSIEAHTAALLQMMPKGPPDWAHHDLTFGQLRLLFMLRQSGSVSIGQLADMLAVTAATASEFVDRVERRGLVVRIHRADDRRVVDCQLSDEGARLLGQIEGARQDALRQVLALLTPDELAEFDHFLELMADRLSASRPPSPQAQGGSQVNLDRPPESPARDAGGRPA